ncbi:MAG: AMP-binding protein [Bryobacter sp.]|nr:AMP-binding protein [Bryobacter sp.]
MLRSLFHLLLRVCFRYRAFDIAALKTPGPVLLVPNHVSWLDFLFLWVLLDLDWKFVVSSTAAQYSWLHRKLMLNRRTFPIDPASPYAVKRMAEHLQKGGRLVLFAEGQITRTGTLGKIFDGTGFLLHKTGAKVITCYLRGANRLRWSRQPGWRRWWPTVTAHFSPVLTAPHLENTSTAKARATLTTWLRDRMIEQQFATEMAHGPATVPEAILETARLRPALEILEDATLKPINYRRLLIGAELLGSRLAAKIGAAPRVGVLLPNVNAMPVTLLGLWAHGKTPAILNFSTGVPTMIACAQLAGLKHVITSRLFLERARLKLEPLVEAGIELIYLDDVRAEIGGLAKLAAALRIRFAPGSLVRKSALGPAGAESTSGVGCACAAHAAGSDGGSPRGVPPHPSPLPRGEGEAAGTTARLDAPADCGRPGPASPSHAAEVVPSPRGEGQGEGKGGEPSTASLASSRGAGNARLQSETGSPNLDTARSHAAQSSSPPAVILFTSGSEGVPKGVELTHQNLLANIRQMLAVVDLTDHDRVFNALPTFHSFGLSVGLLLGLVRGIYVFLYPSPLHYRVIPNVLYDRHCSVFLSTNTFLNGYARKAHPYDFRSMRYLFAAAEKVQEETARTWMQRYGVRLLEGYGATECSPAVSVNVPAAPRLGTVGRLLPGMEMRLEAVEGVAEGGRLFVRGPNVMRGYLNPDADAKFQALGGWYDTGDIVSVDDDGFLSIRGRLKRFAKVSGEMVSLTAVEDALAGAFPQYGQRCEVAVIARPDEDKGEALIAFTNEPRLKLEDLRAAIKGKGLTNLCVPKEVVAVKEIPKLGTGKINHRELAKHLPAHA